MASSAIHLPLIRARHRSPLGRSWRSQVPRPSAATVATCRDLFSVPSSRPAQVHGLDSHSFVSCTGDEACPDAMLVAADFSCSCHCTFTLLVWNQRKLCQKSIVMTTILGSSAASQFLDMSCGRCGAVPLISGVCLGWRRCWAASGKFLGTTDTPHRRFIIPGEQVRLRTPFVGGRI